MWATWPNGRDAFCFDTMVGSAGWTWSNIYLVEVWFLGMTVVYGSRWYAEA